MATKTDRARQRREQAFQVLYDVVLNPLDCTLATASERYDGYGEPLSAPQRQALEAYWEASREWTLIARQKDNSFALLACARR